MVARDPYANWPQIVAPVSERAPPLRRAGREGIASFHLSSEAPPQKGEDAHSPAGLSGNLRGSVLPHFSVVVSTLW